VAGQDGVAVRLATSARGPMSGSLADPFAPVPPLLLAEHRDPCAWYGEPRIRPDVIAEAARPADHDAGLKQCREQLAVGAEERRLARTRWKHAAPIGSVRVAGS